MTLLIGGILRDGVNLVRDFVETPADWFAQIFDFFMDILLRVLSFFFLLFHEMALEFLSYTPYPGKNEGEQHIFTTPDSGSAFYTMINFNNDFIEPFALLMVFFGIIFILFIRIFDIMIQDFGVNTQEGMKRLFIAPIVIVLWMPMANLLLFFAAGMTDWLLTVNLEGVDEIVEDGGLDAADEDGNLNVESYINALGRNEDVNVAVGTLQSIYGLIYGLIAVGTASIIYIFVVFAAAIRILGVYGFYALAPIGVVLWSFKWRGFAKLGGNIIRYFILFAIFPIGVALINLMAPPLLFALQNVMDGVFDELAFSAKDPLSDPDDPTEINATDVISTEEGAAFIFIILTPLLIGVVPWGIIIGFDKAMKAAGIAAAGGVLAAGTIATGGATLATLGAAKGGLAGATLAKGGVMAGLSRGKKAVSKGASRAQTEYKAFSRATPTQKVKMAKANTFSRAGKQAKIFGKGVGKRGRTIRSKGMDSLSNIDNATGRFNDRIDEALNSDEKLRNTARKAGRGFEKGKQFTGRQYSRVASRIGSGYGRAKFMSSRLIPDDLKSIRGVEDRVADSKLLAKYGGKRTKWLQKGAKYHRDIEKGAISGWDDILAANEAYKYMNEDGTGGYSYQSRKQGDGLVPSEDSGERILNDAEFLTLGKKLMENEELVKEFAFKNEISEDSVTEELLADEFFSYLRSPDKDLEDIFSPVHAEAAKETFKDMSYEDIQETLKEDSELRVRYKENREEIYQIEKEKYNNDDNTDTLLEREYRPLLVDMDEAPIKGLDSEVKNVITDTVSNELASNLESFENITDLNAGTKPMEVFMKNLADDIINTDGSIQQIGNALDRNSDVAQLTDGDLQAIVNTVHNGLQSNVGTIGDGYLDSGMQGIEIIQEANKSRNSSNMSIQELDNSRGEAAANFRESTEIIRDGNVSQEELTQFLGNTEVVVEGQMGDELKNALNVFEESMNEIQRNYSLDNREFKDELMKNNNVINDILDDIQNGNILDNEHNLFQMIEKSLDHANHRANDSQRLTDDEIKQTVGAMIKIQSKDTIGIDESRIDNLERGLEAQIQQSHTNLMNSLTNNKSKEVVDKYNNTDNSLNDILRDLDSNDRPKVINELMDLKFGDLGQ